MAVLSWPSKVQLQLYEKGTLRDTFLGEVCVAVPGVEGTPPADAAPVPYEWTSPESFMAPWEEPVPPGNLDALMLCTAHTSLK